ncbi:MAG TPA: RNA 2',3'-cyclic phosphodiesterase [Candidatus Krumholzibacteria bacterium]|nr:RNA 2',3'-cyclic phosphodiesterase [Candidatus Krumholzibacteria bacterium]
MRLFVAVNLDAATRAAIQRAIDTFPLPDPPWRWSGPSTWHITLKFIGETPPGDRERIIAALAPVARGHAAFDLALGALGGFPSLRAPRVLFYSVASGAGACSTLAHDIDAALGDALAVEREARHFHAHATVARIQHRVTADVTAALTRVPAIAVPALRVTGFELMESRLGRGGAVYSVVARFPLA